MEYKKRCRTCGKVYCYTDEDLKKNTQNSAMATISALGGLASIFGGTIFHTAHLNNQTQKYNDKIVDYTKCPYCNSRDIASISNEEYTKITNEIGVGSNKKIEVNANATPESLIKRAELFLEDGEWDYADAYADACLDIEPENTYAYVCKLLAELKIKKMDYLVKCNTPFDDSNNFKKALRFADDELKATLIEHLEKAKKNQRAMQFDSIYHNAKKKMVGEEISNYESAIKLFQTIANWKDANSQIEICQQIISEINERRIQKKIEQERIADEKRRENEKNTKRNKKIAIIVTPIIVCIIAFIIVLNSLIIPQMRYDKAMTLMENKKYEEAIEVFSLAGNIKDSEEQLKNAVMLCNKKWGNVISTGYGHTVGLKKDGTVIATEYYGKLPYVNEYHGQCDVSEWKGIVAISAGGSHTLGLKSDGTVVVTRLQNSVLDIYIENWTDIISISAGDAHAVGLKSDGTVVATGYNKDGQCNVSEWTDIVSISAGKYHTVGLKSDGTVVAAGMTKYGVLDVGNWTDIIAISAGECHTVGLKSNGTVVAVGNGYSGVYNVGNWTDIIAISACGDIVGLKSDGTVVIADEDKKNKVADWKNIVAVSDGALHTVGLKTDGKIVTIKSDLGPDYYSGQCDVQDWNLFR